MSELSDDSANKEVPESDVPHNLGTANEAVNDASTTPSASDPTPPGAPEVPDETGTFDHPEAPAALEAPETPQPADEQLEPSSAEPLEQSPMADSTAAAGEPAPAGQPAPADQPTPSGEPAAADQQSTDAKARRKRSSRSGALVAGIAAAALVGGIAGAGVTALTIGQFSGTDASNYSRETLTNANPKDATVISAVAQAAVPSVVTLEVSSENFGGSGSGVIIESDGYILTNNHVVSGSTSETSIRVFLSDGRILPGEVIGTDPYSDLAVVKIDATGLPTIPFANSEKLNVGDLTVAIGAPLNLASTVTSGVISAMYRGITVGTAELEDAPQEQPNDPNDLWNFEFNQPKQREQDAPPNAGSITIPVIQTDASINPGNSGGALLNNEGKLIGINVAIASTAATEGTAGSVGLGFAIPSNLAKRVSEALIAGDKVSHGKLGVSVGDAAGDSEAMQRGALVQDVISGGAGDKAGLKKGDVVTSINGIPVTDGTSLSGLVRYYPAGTEVKIEYIRDGKVNTTKATLDSL